MPRTLLTGANGFVGKILCQALRQAGHHVVALSGRQGSQASHADEHLEADIRDADAVGQAVLAARPDHVIHLAAVSHVGTSFKEPLLTWQTNVMGSLNLLEALREHAPHAFVLFTSSSEVYGATFKRGEPLGEDAPCQPLNPYAASKLAAEAAFNEYFRQGMPGVIARPFNHIGAGQSPDFVTASFARQIALIEAGKQPPQLKVGNLLAERDFLDVRDVCGAYLKLLELAVQPVGSYARCYNISSGQPRRIRSMLDTLLELTDASIEVVEDSERMRPSDIPSASGNSAAIRLATGWQPAFDIRQTLSHLLQDWREQVQSPSFDTN